MVLVDWSLEGSKREKEELSSNLQMSTEDVSRCPMDCTINSSVLLQTLRNNINQQALEARKHRILIELETVCYQDVLRIFMV